MKKWNTWILLFGLLWIAPHGHGFYHHNFEQQKEYPVLVESSLDTDLTLPSYFGYFWTPLKSIGLPFCSPLIALSAKQALLSRTKLRQQLFLSFVPDAAIRKWYIMVRQEQVGLNNG